MNSDWAKCKFIAQFTVRAMVLLPLGAFLWIAPLALHADSVNSPNITMNVDTNRSTGNGAGNVAITVNTITVAETMLPEYSSGSGKAISLKVRPGYQFVSTSPVTAQSATVGINGNGLNVAASITPVGSADEILTFNLTSGTNASVQDIIRINGVKLKILSAEGAAGPAQNTISLTTSTAGGAFSNQGIVAANITRGQPDHLLLAVQPGDNQAGVALLPSVKLVDFGGNLITNSDRAIALTLSTNPTGTALLGTTARAMSNGVATWSASDGLMLTAASAGYELQATQAGTALQTSDSVTSLPFEISAGDPGSLQITTQPANTTAGGDIVLAVATLDQFGNPTSSNDVEVVLESAVNPGGWPLLVDTSLTKTTSNGVARWEADDNLRINKAVAGYKLSVSGLGEPVLTDAFDISAGQVETLKFIDQPQDAAVDAAITPPVTVQATDGFGNLVDTAVAITVSASQCSGTVSGGSASTVAGIATFDALKLSEPCVDATLEASASDLLGAVSDTFTIRAADEFPLQVSSINFRPKRSFRYLATGSFTPSLVSVDDPTKQGAILTITGSSGVATFPLLKRGWRKIGTHSFRFTSKRCPSVLIKPNFVRAVCLKHAGTLNLPETDLQVVLKVGQGTQRFCAACGGTALGDESKIFKRVNCEAPAFCP